MSKRKFMPCDINFRITQDAGEILSNQCHVVGGGSGGVGLKYFTSLTVCGKESGPRFMACELEPNDLSGCSIITISGIDFYVDDQTMALLENKEMIVEVERKTVKHKDGEFVTEERVLRVR